MHTSTVHTGTQQKYSLGRENNRNVVVILVQQFIREDDATIESDL